MSRPAILRVALFLLGAAAAACGPAPAEFPVGFFGVETPADARALAAQGFTAVQFYPPEPAKVAEMAAATRGTGQLLLAPLEEAAKSGRPSDFAGTWAYLRDEPDVIHMSVAELKAKETAVHDWAPGLKTAFVVGDGRKAKDYPGVGDAIMVDWYPVPHLDLASAGDMVRLTAEAAGGRRVWAVLQAFDWRGSPQRDPTKPRIGRFPTKDEVRFMSYDAVLNGAQGVWYFAYSTAAGTNLAQTPELYERVLGPAREIQAMAPIFARGKPMPLPWAPGATPVAARAWRYRGRDYLVLADRDKALYMAIPQELTDGSWRPLFEARRDPKEFLPRINGEYGLAPHQVLVLESRLRWR